MQPANFGMRAPTTSILSTIAPGGLASLAESALNSLKIHTNDAEAERVRENVNRLSTKVW
jgi:hypothetical protein